MTLLPRWKRSLSVPEPYLWYVLRTFMAGLRYGYPPCCVFAYCRILWRGHPPAMYLWHRHGLDWRKTRLSPMKHVPCERCYALDPVVEPPGEPEPEQADEEFCQESRALMGTQGHGFNCQNFPTYRSRTRRHGFQSARAAMPAWSDLAAPLMGEVLQLGPDWFQVYGKHRPCRSPRRERGPWVSCRAEFCGDRLTFIWPHGLPWQIRR